LLDFVSDHLGVVLAERAQELSGLEFSIGSHAFPLFNGQKKLLPVLWTEVISLHPCAELFKSDFIAPFLVKF
jgi:hypothetical protein